MGSTLGWPRTAIGFLLRFMAACAAVFCLSANAYDLRIGNQTNLPARGQVNYAACKADVFSVSPGQTWSTNGRGLCLITGISVVLVPPVAGQAAPTVTSYSSTGTAYTDFAITVTDGGAYRVLSAAELARQPAPTVMAPTGPTAQWKEVLAGQAAPADAFKGGRQRMGGQNDAAGNPVYTLLPVCRAQVNGAWAIGNAAPYYGMGNSDPKKNGWQWNEYRCYVYLNNKEQELANYEVLIIEPQVLIRSPNSVRWAGASGGVVPTGAYNAAKSGAAQQVCRAQQADGGDLYVRVGMMGDGACLYPYGGRNQRADNYEVLVVDMGASQQLARGANEPRLAAEPDRPAVVNAALALPAYKVNAVTQTDNAGRELVRYKKTRGNIWEETNFFGVVTPRVRPFVEVGRSDDTITLFSGPHDFGGPNGKATSQYVTFSFADEKRRIGNSDQLLRRGAITWMNSDPQYREGYKWYSTEGKIARAMRAEPDTVASMVLKPLNAAQKTSFWTTGNPPPLFVKGTDGKFGNYSVGATDNGWLELYATYSQRVGSATQWKIHFLRVDFWRNRVWETYSVSDKAPEGLDNVAGLRAQALSGDKSKAWAEAYELAEASVFTVDNIGQVLARLPNGQQIGWTLREARQRDGLYWEESRGDAAVAKGSGVAEDRPIGEFLKELPAPPQPRSGNTLTLSGKSSLGSPLVIDWVQNTVTVGGKKVADFVSGSAEYPGQRKRVRAPMAPGISPGFQFINRTDWPIAVKIGQVGCLYHDVIPPGGTMTRDTGAVWFTLSAAFSDGKGMTKEQIFTECVSPVYFTTMGVILSAATAGSAAGFVALGAAAALTEGVASTAIEFMSATNMSDKEKTAVVAGIYVASAALSGGVTGFRVVSKAIPPGVARSAFKKELASAAIKGMGKEGLQAIKDQGIELAKEHVMSTLTEPDDQQMKTLQSWFDSEIRLPGQYAGYPWPWPSSDRVMPQYEITGGPRIDQLPSAPGENNVLIRKGKPFEMKKVN